VGNKIICTFCLKTVHGGTVASRSTTNADRAAGHRYARDKGWSEAVQWRTADGILHMASMDDLPPMGWWQDWAPVRVPASFRGATSKAGWQYLATLDEMKSYESLLEGYFLLELDLAGDVEAVLPQPLRLYFDRSRAPLTHVPDYLVLRRTGRSELVDVKGALHAGKPLNRVAFDLTAEFAHRLGWTFALVHEPTEARYATVKHLAGYRRAASADLARAASAVARFVADWPGQTWAQAEAALVSSGTPLYLAAPAIGHAIWRGTVAVDLDAALTENTALHPRGGGHG
jgi:hypothetical protein